MNIGDDPMSGDGLERALDRALQRNLPAPALPAGFRQRLQAAMMRSDEHNQATLSAALEREHEEQLAALQSDYVRLRQRTLGTLIGVALYITGLNFAPLIGVAVVFRQQVDQHGRNLVLVQFRFRHFFRQRHLECRCADRRAAARSHHDRSRGLEPGDG